MVRAALIVAASIASSGTANIVGNGSFEDAPLTAPGRVGIDNLETWDASGGFMLLERGVNGVSNIAAHTGEQFVTMGHSGATGDTLSQVVDSFPGGEFFVEFYVASVQGSAPQTVRAEARSFDTGALLGGMDAEVSNVADGWVRFVYTFTADDIGVEIRFVHTIGNSSANVALDSVNMGIVPAPGGLAILAAAGLAVRRRR
jgi:hypothetical protein